jgi:uncharacterized protein (TIRG00374 family)
VAILALAATYFVSAFIYTLLAKKKVKYLLTVSVQVACSFANRLLPSGIGGISLNIDYLIKQKHKPAEAASVSAMNSAVALTSHIIMVVIALAISHPTFGNFMDDKKIPVWPIVAICLVAASLVLILWGYKDLRKKILKLIKDTWANFLSFRYQPAKVILATLSAAAVTIFYVLGFYACARSVGLPITMLQAFLVYTIGVLLGTATMTPGGLGGVEAGLVGGLVAVYNDFGLAFSAVIIFRLLTFWLPILPGYLAFWMLQKAHKI